MHGEAFKYGRILFKSEVSYLSSLNRIRNCDPKFRKQKVA